MVTFKKTKRYLLSILMVFGVVFLASGGWLLSAGLNSLPQEAYALSQEAASAPEAPSDLNELRNSDGAQLDGWAKSLKSFDGREFGYITPEKNQGGLGICWAYAAIGAMEAGILREGFDPGASRDNLDLDELIAAYVRYNRNGKHDPLYLTTNDTYSLENWRSNGGFAHEAFMAMSQGFSPDKQVTTEYYKDWAIEQAITESRYFVQGFMPVEKDREAIKRAVLEYGSVTMEYKAPVSTTQTYLYHSDGTSLGHASLIVGWDDSIPKTVFWPNQPESDGAWIVKNSWGYGGKEVNGTCCFYLAYDSYLGNNLYVVDMDLKENYPNIYYYDGEVTDNEIQYITDAHGAIFEAKLSSEVGQEQLKAISLGIRNDKLTADIKIYRHLKANPGNVNDPVNKPDSGVLAAQKKVYFERQGFYTVDLDEPINLDQGEYFSIVIGGRDAGNNPLFPLYAYDSGQSVNDMTYRLYGGQWTSLKSGGGLYADGSSGLCVRLRAITDTVKREPTGANDLKYARIELSGRFFYYQKGKEQTPQITVYYGDEILQYNRDYTIAFSDNVKPGGATVEIKGINNYTGSRTTCFEVAKPKYPPGALTGTVTVYRDTNRLYEIQIPPGWKWIDNDYVLEMGLSSFSHALRYTGDDADCYQTVTCSVHINKLNEDSPDKTDISGATVEIEGEYTYNGEQIIPDVTVTLNGQKLNMGVDYFLTCQNNRDAGQASVTVRGTGKYGGEVSKFFVINKAQSPKERPDGTMNIKRDVTRLAEVPLNCANWAWENPDTLITGDTFDAAAVYTGSDKSNYIDIHVQITLIRQAQTDIAWVDLSLDSTLFVYDGLEKTPNVIAKTGDYVLRRDIDFTVEYQDNVNAGTQARAIVKGINDYTGSKTLTFTIEKADYPQETPEREIIVDRKTETLKSVSLLPGWSWEAADMAIDGEEISAWAEYCDKDNYINFRVLITIKKAQPKDASLLDVRLEKTQYVYDGTPKMPAVTVKDGDWELSPGDSYDVVYLNNKNAGEGKVVVTFKNDYKGLKEIPFTISKAERPDAGTVIRTDTRPAKLSDVPLPYGFVWQDQTLEVSSSGMKAAAVYVAEDAVNFLITQIEFEIVFEEQAQPQKPDLLPPIAAGIAALCGVALLAGAAIIIAKIRRNKA